MSKVAENLERLRNHRGYNRAELARRAGLNHTAVRDIETGRIKNPRIDTMNALADALRVDAAALTDSGMVDKVIFGALGEPASDYLQNHLGKTGLPSGNEPKSKGAVAPAPADADLRDGLEVGGTIFAAVPRFDLAASAGPGALIDDNANEHADGYQLIDLVSLQRLTSAPAESIASITVRGDSMDPTLRHGDQILIDRSVAKPTDGIFVIHAYGELLVKRLTVNLGAEIIHVSSDNDLHPDFQIKAAEQDRLFIVGRVIWIGRGIA